MTDPSITAQNAPMEQDNGQMTPPLAPCDPADDTSGVGPSASEGQAEQGMEAENAAESCIAMPQTSEQAGEEIPAIETDKDNAVQEPQTEQTAAESSEPVPQYTLPDWQERVQTFLQEVPAAQRFVRAIGQELLNDPALAQRPDCLEAACNRVLSQAYRPPEELVQDPEFCKRYVYDNPHIQAAVIERYLRALQQHQPPRTLPRSGQFALAPTDKPRSIREAGKIMQEMLTHRRNTW